MRLYGYNLTGPTERMSRVNQCLCLAKVYFNYWFWPVIDKPKLVGLKNKHKGKRCFIIGNGPSLNGVNLDLLKDEITFATNGIFLLFDRTKFRPTYYLVEDNLVAEDRSREINAIRGITKFVPLRSSYCINRSGTIYLNHNPEEDVVAESLVDGRFSLDASLLTVGGNTVTFTCMEMAYHMGFGQVYLLGIDHNYEIPKSYRNKSKDENYVIESKEDDKNHFDQRYFGKGYRWHNPKVHLMEESYKIAKKVFEADGRQILNATMGTKLDVFEKVNLGRLFA